MSNRLTPFVKICKLKRSTGDRGFFFVKSNNSGLFLLALLLLGYWLGLTVFSATAKLIIGLAQPAAAELIVANSLSRCISPHAHMEEIKPAKLIQTCRFFFMHIARICMLV